MKISIEGSIASGKSTLCASLNKATRIPVFLEPIDSWTLLDKFYEDSRRWGLTFNVEVLLSMYQWKDNSFNSIYERSPNSCKHVFTQLMLDDGTLEVAEKNIFDKMFKTFGWDQDVIIYVRTPPNVCFERMNKRGRECENTVSYEYLEKLDKKHNEMLEHLKKDKPIIKIFYVDGTQSAEDVHKEVLGILKHLDVI
jgi:thymidine kinase